VTLLAAALAVAIGSIAVLVDYRKLEKLDWISELIQAIGTERAPDAQTTLEEVAAQIHFFSPHRDYSLALGRPLTKENFESKVLVVDRAMSRMPNVNLIHLRILLAVLEGDPQTARSHLRRALKFHPQHAKALIESIRGRVKARPDEFGILGQILDEELTRVPEPRW
jgi:hypothetical protein